MRRIALGLLVALAVAACARDDASSPQVVLGEPSTTQPAVGGRPVVPGPSTTAAPLPAGPGATRPTSTTAPPQRGGGADRGTPTADAIATAARGPVGAFARTLLRPRPASRLVLEVQQQADASPLAESLAYATQTLSEVTGKQVGVTRVSLPAGARRWSAADLVRLAEANAGTPQGGSTAVVRLLAVRGTLAENENAVGVAVRGDLMAIFPDQVAQVTSPIVSRRQVEDAVLVHELGHLLGLVDLVLDRDRADPEHPEHSPNRASVMYWAVESTLLGQALDGPPPRSFDADDRADLAAIRNGA